MQPYDQHSMAASRFAAQAPSQATASRFPTQAPSQDAYLPTYVPTRQPSPPPQRHMSPTLDLESRGLKSQPLGRQSFVGVALVILVVLCSLPIWDALVLLDNFNYAMWGDRSLPEVLIVGSLGLIALFIILAEIMFWCSAHAPYASQTLVMASSLILTLVGIMLVTVSFPLSQNALTTYNDITYNCMGIEQAREIHFEYEKLLSLRTTPACAAQYTIEACEGYNASSPHMAYIKRMESTFSCSGFCHQSGGVALQQASVNTSGVAVPAPQVSLLRKARGTGSKASALQLDQRLRTDEASHGEVSASESSTAFPPALFSTQIYTKSCDGAVARQMINVSNDFAFQLWYTGVAVVIVSLVVSMKEWTSKVDQ